MKKSSSLSPLINSLSLDIDNLTVDDIHALEQDIAHEINVVRHKYSNDPNFKGKPLFLKFCIKCSRSGHSISTCPEREHFMQNFRQRYIKPLDKPNFQKQTFNQAMKGNQNLPNRQVTSNNMTGKPLPFSHPSRSISREHRNHLRHRSPNKLSKNNSKPFYANSNCKPPSRNGSPYPRTNFQTNSQYNSRPQSPHYNQDGNCSRRPFLRNRLHNVRN